METVLIGGRLIDGTGREPIDNAGLVIEGGKISQVGRSDELHRSSEARVIDVEGRTIMPGLIDAHTHLTYHVTSLDLWQLELRESVELNTVKATLNARALLDMGFTTIADGGCRGYIGPAIRDAVAQGLIPGPRGVSSGPILCGSAGLLDSTPAWVRFESDAALGTTVDGPEEVRRAVRQQIKAGVDFVKVSASGVAGSRFSNALTEDLEYDEIAAAVREAAKYRKHVHAHAHSREGIRASVEAGVLSLHSGEFVDDEVLLLMKERGVIFSPTIAWLHARTLPEYPPAQDPAFVEEARSAFDAAADAIVRARELGTKIAIGTDASHRFPHVPDGVLEMEYFQELGYPALEVITAATKTAAESMARGDVLGTLEPGKLADALVVEGNPWDDVRALRDKRNIVRLFQGGKEVALSPDRGLIGGDFSVADALANDRVREPTGSR
jgi:imidazolonepropionase-like amidohydrolase